MEQIVNNVTNIHYPTKITEERAPTDESIRLAEEYHEKALQNIIAKVRIDNNLVTGEAFMVKQPWIEDDLRLIVKFKINGKEYNVDHTLSSRDIEFNNYKEINEIHGNALLKERAQAIILWHTMRHLQALVYEQITGNKFPKEYL